MPHSLEWSRAYTARLSESDAAGCEARSAELAQRLARETAAGELPFLSMPYRAKLEVERERLLSPYELRRRAEDFGMREPRPGQVRRMEIH